MAKAKKYADLVVALESGEIELDETHVKRADITVEAEVEHSLGLQMISIRLQKRLIHDLKFISTAHGIGYQPLIRDILSRFVAHEVKQIIRDTIERRQLEEKELLQKEDDGKLSMDDCPDYPSDGQMAA